ncbi:MAG: nucleoside transporter C-terminal domain-containing protein [bacterium]
MDLVISIFRGIIGLTILVGIAFLISNNKKRINWKLVVNGLTLQLILAVFLIKGNTLEQWFSPLGWPKRFFEWISLGFVKILDFSNAGASFLFGDLAKAVGVEGSMGAFFAFQVLPTIIFFASFMSILYYLGIMQRIVQGMAWVMAKFMGTSGAESLSVTADIFVGQTEAPLIIRPFLKGMTDSELLTIMTGGLATIAGGVMAAYIQMLGSTSAEILGVPLETAKVIFASHLLCASVMAAPAALVLAKIIIPETEEPETKGSVKIVIEKNGSNIAEAAANGASDGLQLALNVGAMLIAFIALVAMCNAGIQYLGDLFGWNGYFISTFGQPLNLQLMFGLVLQFVAYGIGVPWHDSIHFGSLLGTKMVLNEFVAYSDFSKMLQIKSITDVKTIVMATYALCGFANIGSIGILIGGISPLAPNKKSTIAKLGVRALIAGTLATLMTATLAGILY